MHVCEEGMVMLRAGEGKKGQLRLPRLKLHQLPHLDECALAKVGAAAQPVADLARDAPDLRLELAVLDDVEAVRMCVTL